MHSLFDVSGRKYCMQRLGHPATRAVAQEKRRDFSPALAACGGGHIPVPGYYY
jgi:hypothetical protein